MSSKVFLMMRENTNLNKQTVKRSWDHKVIVATSLLLHGNDKILDKCGVVLERTLT